MACLGVERHLHCFPIAVHAALVALEVHRMRRGDIWLKLQPLSSQQGREDSSLVKGLGLQWSPCYLEGHAVVLLAM